jgi:hypothetical protein
VRRFERQDIGAEFATLGYTLGTSYTSRAVMADGTDLPVVTDPLGDYVPTARPGSRAPHVWLERQGERLSTLDLFDRSFVLLAGSAGHAWHRAGRLAAESLEGTLSSYRVGGDGELQEQQQDWATAYGIQPDGAVLVRPDGYVAWRSAISAPEPVGALERVLKAVLGKELD